MTADHLTPEQWERLAWEQEVVCVCGHPFLAHEQRLDPLLQCHHACSCPMYEPDESKVRLDLLSDTALD